MAFFRASIEIDIVATDRAEADDRLSLLIGELAARGRPWMIEVLPNRLEERLPLPLSPPLSAQSGSW